MTFRENCFIVKKRLACAEYSDGYKVGFKAGENDVPLKEIDMTGKSTRWHYGFHQGFDAAQATGSPLGEP